MDGVRAGFCPFAGLGQEESPTLLWAEMTERAKFPGE